MAKRAINKQTRLGSDHNKEIPKIKRLKGQLEGVERMIDEQRYCGDILDQLRAIKSGIISVEASILETHINNCVVEALRSSKKTSSKEMVEELIRLFKHNANRDRFDSFKDSAHTYAYYYRTF